MSASSRVPLAAQRLARAGRHAAIVACGLVVDGGIYRHEFVARQFVAKGQEAARAWLQVRKVARQLDLDLAVTPA